MSESLIFMGRVLAAEFIVLSVFYISYTLALRLTKGQDTLIRWSAAVVIGMSLLSVLFHCLLVLRMFNLIVSLIILGGVDLLTHLFIRSFQIVFSEFFKDIIWLKQQCASMLKSRYRFFYLLCLLFIILTFLRTIQIPPLAWDSLVYHAVKPAMWIQNHGPIIMRAPGGWMAQITYHGGSEMLMAWAMLPFHSDLLTGVVDAVQWIMLGMVCYAVCRQLQISPRYRWVVIFYCLFVPAMALSVGTGYVETSTMLTLMLGLLFLLLYFRNPRMIYISLSALAFGLAAGTKITILTIVCMLWIILLFRSFFLKHIKIKLYDIILSFFLFILICGPWLLWSYYYSGYPFGHIPLKLFGMTLGKSTPILDWNIGQSQLHIPALSEELKAFFKLFNKPCINEPHASFLSLIPIFCCFIAIIKTFRKNPWRSLIFLGWIIAVAAYYFHPNFTRYRIGWAANNGRFMLPLIIPAVLFSYLAFKRHSAWSRAYTIFLMAGTFIHIMAFAFRGWAKIEIIAVSLMAAVFACVTFLLIRFRNKINKKYLIIMLAGLPLFSLPGINFYREHLRYFLTYYSTINHPFKYPYWTRPTMHVDRPPHTYKIAVTSGSFRNSMTWFTYYFLGKKLQNSLEYVPISRTGKIIDFEETGEREKQADYESWIQRIENRKIDYVMSFFPHSIELDWMLAHPEKFKSIEKDESKPGEWGFFEVLN